jgi:uncharacterized protein YqeY
VSLKNRIQQDMKTAMRERDKSRLGAVRLIMAAIKQREVDDRVEAGDDLVLGILEKMVKQRRESIGHFEQAGRDDLIATEEAELAVINHYLPEPLDAAALTGLIDQAIVETGAENIRDMGKVMGLLKAKAQGRADMAEVSKQVKARLGA